MLRTNNNNNHINGWSTGGKNGDVKTPTTTSPVKSLRDEYFANGNGESINHHNNNNNNNHNLNGWSSPTKKSNGNGIPYSAMDTPAVETQLQQSQSPSNYHHTTTTTPAAELSHVNGNGYSAAYTDEPQSLAAVNGSVVAASAALTVSEKEPAEEDQLIVQNNLNNNHHNVNNNINKGNGLPPTTNGQSHLQGNLRLMNGCLSQTATNGGSKPANGLDKECDESDPLTGVCGDKDTMRRRLNESDPDDGDTDGEETKIRKDLEESADDDRICGIGSCRPKWATKLASTKVFMVVFLLAWVLQGMYSTYFVSVITTIEKLFQIPSKITGVLLSVAEIGQISTALFLTYYAGRGHRPRWIACGMVVFAISVFGTTLPHFFYGERLLNHRNSMNTRNNIVPYFNVSESLTSPDFASNSITSNLCMAQEYGRKNHTQCEQTESDHEAEVMRWIVLAMFTVSFLGVGVGMTAVSTLGIPYIDDNVASRDSPIYIAITIGVRILGPAGGFIVGSFCTRVYMNLEDPGFNTSDPRWVGAWWLGLLLVSCSMMLTSMAMFLFPKQLRGNRIPAPEKVRAMEEQKKLEKQQEERPQWKHFPATIRRMLQNDILMCRTASSVLHLLPVAGLYTFLPKYLETQFRLPAHDANLVVALNGILVMGLGIVISGFVILKCNPMARSVAGWIAVTAFVYTCGMGVLMFLGCPMDDMVGLNLTRPESTNQLAPFSSNRYFAPTCDLDCGCDFNTFQPICGADNYTYFSACHAGCNKSVSVDGVTEFFDCKCISTVADGIGGYDQGARGNRAVSGYCNLHCDRFLPFIILFTVIVFVHSTGEVGSILLIMRCTDPKDKTMAMGIIQFAIGLFGNVPCPIIYGAIVDTACLVWDTICDKTGACSLYNGEMFRHSFLGLTATIMGLAFIMDVIVWRKAHRIDIDPSANSETDSEKPAVPESTV